MLGLKNSNVFAPSNFIFDEQARRLHWIVDPISDDESFRFVSYDVNKGSTISYAINLKR